MSTSVYKPLGSSFLGRSPETPDKLFYRSDVQKVKRSLFGPVDHAETQKFLERELDKISVSQSETWNFDLIREQTIDPNGRFVWRPATPHKNIRPIKKLPNLEDNTLELYGHPVDIIRPTPIKPSQEDLEMQSPPNTTRKSQPQRLITEFMAETKKRPTFDYQKKEWSSTLERPSKLPRRSELSSKRPAEIIKPSSTLLQI